MSFHYDLVIAKISVLALVIGNEKYWYQPIKLLSVKV